MVVCRIQRHKKEESDMACGCNHVYHNTRTTENAARKWDKVIYATQNPCNENTADWLSAMQTAARQGCGRELPAGCSERRYSLAEIVWLLMTLFHHE